MTPLDNRDGIDAPQKVAMPDVRTVQSFVCEFVGTFFLVLTISLSRSSNGPNVLEHYIAVGCCLGSMIYAFDHISGAHFNPAVTFGAALSRRIPYATAALYVVAQVLGGIFGALLATAVSSPSASASAPFAPASIWAALGVEALYTFALVLVMQNAALEKNAKEPNSYFGLAVAFTALAGAGAVGPISGGYFNPAVGTGLTFASLADGAGSMANVWIYWVGPLGGAALATLVRIYMNLPSHQESEGLPLVVPLTEAVGTFFVVLTAALTGEGMAVGSMLLAMVYMGDHVCGADYNPAVTMGVAIRMAVPFKEYWKVLVTLLAQFVGAFLAALTAVGVNGGQLQYPASDIIHGVAGAVVFEAIWTGLLVYVVCAVMTPTSGLGSQEELEEHERVEERSGHARSYQGLAIGFVVVAGIYCSAAGGGGSGGVFNPALGTAIMSIDAAFNGKAIANMWVYWLGPFIGSVLGAGLFTLLHYHKDPVILDYIVEVDYGGAQWDTTGRGAPGGGGQGGGGYGP